MKQIKRQILKLNDNIEKDIPSIKDVPSTTTEKYLTYNDAWKKRNELLKAGIFSKLEKHYSPYYHVLTY